LAKQGSSESRTWSRHSLQGLVWSRCSPSCHGAASASQQERSRYDTRCYFNVRSKADTSQLNLPHGTNNQKASVARSRRCSDHAVAITWCHGARYGKTPYTKPELGYITYRNAARTGPSSVQNLVKVDRVVPAIYSLTNRRTNLQPQTNTASVVISCAASLCRQARRQRRW